MNDITVDYLVKRLTSMKDRAEKTMAEFSEKLTGNHSAYVMEWADSAFVAAAKIEFANKLLELLTADPRDLNRDKVDIVVDDIRRSVLSMSRNISNQSTSDCTNIMKRERLEVAARFLNELNLGVSNESAS